MYRQHLSCVLQFLLWLNLAIITSASRFDYYTYGDHLFPFGLGGERRPYTSVGPPNPAPECLELFGVVQKIDAFSTLSELLPTEYEQSRLRGEDIPQFTTNFGFRPTCDYYDTPWFIDRRQFMGPGASPRQETVHKYLLPKTWSSRADPSIQFRGPDCRVTLMTHTDPGALNKDMATWHDFKERLYNIVQTCHRDLRHLQGGYQIFGESNKLALFIYNANSEFDDAINVKAGCVRRGKDKVFVMLTRLGFFSRTCSEAEEASSSSASDLASTSHPHVCKQDTVQSSSIIYGLREGSHTTHTIVTWCCGLIVDIMKGFDS